MIQLHQTYRPADLLPQRPPMLLIDSIDDYGEDWLRASVAIRPESVFYQAPLGVPAYVGLEYMAQTAAAHGGLGLVQRGELPSICLLLGCREYRCNVGHFPHATILRIEARQLLRDDRDFVAYDCTISRNSSVLARSTLKAVQPQDIASVVERQLYD